MYSTNNENSSRCKIPTQKLPFIDDDAFGRFKITKGVTPGWQDDLLNNLSKLRKANYTKELSVSINLIKDEQCFMTEEIAQSLEDTFRHYSERTEWDMRFEQFCEDCPHCNKVLRAVCTTQLFRCLEIVSKGKMTHEISVSLRDAMIADRGVDIIITKSLTICEEAAFVLSEGLKKTSRLNQFHIEGYDDPIFVGDKTNSALACLVEGLSQNKSLRSFDLMSTNLPDASVTQIVEALIGHPAITILEIQENRCGELTIQALKSLLMDDSCSIAALHFYREDENDEESKKQINVDALVEGLKACYSISHLNLDGYHFDLSDLEKLFNGLCKCPNLKCLSIADCKISVELSKIFVLLCKCPQLTDVFLSSNEISKLGSCKIPDLKRAELIGAPKVKESRLVRLNLEDNDVMENIESGDLEEALVDVLRVNPHLRSFGFENEDATQVFSSKVSSLLDMNRCRKMFNLLQDDKFPLSCWPNVLQKVAHVCGDKEDTVRQMNITYELIKGLSNDLGKAGTTKRHLTSEPLMKRQKIETVNAK